MGLQEVCLALWLLLREMELAIWVQILGKAVCVSLCTNTLEKGMNLSVLNPNYGYIVEQTGSFSLG